MLDPEPTGKAIPRRYFPNVLSMKPPCPSPFCSYNHRRKAHVKEISTRGGGASWGISDAIFWHSLDYRSNIINGSDGSSRHRDFVQSEQHILWHSRTNLGQHVCDIVGVGYIPYFALGAGFLWWESIGKDRVRNRLNASFSNAILAKLRVGGPTPPPATIFI